MAGGGIRHCLAYCKFAVPAVGVDPSLWVKGSLPPTTRTCFPPLDRVCSHYFGGYDLSDTLSSPSYYVVCSFGHDSFVVLGVFGRRALRGPGLVPRTYRRIKVAIQSHHFPGIRVSVKDTARFTPAGNSTDQVSHTYHWGLAMRRFCL